MAEIKLKRKQPVLWPWALGAMAVVVTGWLLFTEGPRDTPATTTTTATTPAAPVLDEPPMPVPDPEMPAPRVAAFLTFARSAPTADEEAPAARAADGAERLVAALTELVSAHASDEAAAQSRLAEVRSSAARLTAEGGQPANAERLRNVFIGAADVLAEVERSRSLPAAELDSSIDAMRQAGMAVDEARPLREQGDRIDQFFERSADAVRSLSELPDASADR